MSIDKTTIHNDIQRFEEHRQKEYRKLYDKFKNSDLIIKNNRNHFV